MLCVSLSDKYEKEGSFTSNVTIDAAIIALIIKRIIPIVSRILFLKKGIWEKSAELLNFKTIKGH